MKDLRKRTCSAPHTERELRGALAETGFGSVRVYDAFTLEPPKPESERLQFIAKKDNT